MLGRLKRTVGVMWWMMTYLESSRNIPYMQGSRSRMAAEDGLARGWNGFGCTTSSVSADRT